MVDLVARATGHFSLSAATSLYFLSDFDHSHLVEQTRAGQQGAEVGHKQQILVLDGGIEEVGHGHLPTGVGSGVIHQSNHRRVSRCDEPFPLHISAVEHAAAGERLEHYCQHVAD